MVLNFSASRIRTIDMESHYKPEDACRQMFYDWLDGDCDLRGPITWNTLIQCLKEVDLNNVVESLHSIFNQVYIVNDATLYTNSVYYYDDYNSIQKTDHDGQSNNLSISSNKSDKGV